MIYFIQALFDYDKIGEKHHEEEKQFIREILMIKFLKDMNLTKQYRIYFLEEPNTKQHPQYLIKLVYSELDSGA
jgi:hypothetical protein